jgi:hypothetical protein
MKKLLVLSTRIIGSFFVLLMLCYCGNKKSDSSVSKRDDFPWILGNWERTNEQPGKRTFERWEEVNDSLLRGMGYTLQGTDTVFKELLRLERQNNNWEYVVRMPGEKRETRFAITQRTDTSFTCRNDKNEFPKQIRYFKSGNDIRADISDDSTTIDFTFKRIK